MIREFRDFSVFQAPTNNRNTGSDASESDDNGDGDSDSSTHQNAQRVRAGSR
jgi:hypothetical protein